ncbi:mRNA export factor GLE1-like [Uloborus diversus]|uniref:mRNA export factor GLE1-like n=1 Tax=Uloborus diversus TaxID=327109 RepID=UPI00240A48C7|nr:mRNA export factor GLE1-like [Uloborus diversus]
MDVGTALRNTSKGKLKYDRYWMEEGRTREILDDISEYSTNVKISVSPKILAVICSTSCTTEKADDREVDSPDVTAPKKLDPTADIADAYFFELQSELEFPISEYEKERRKYIQDKLKCKQNEFEIHSKELRQQTEQVYQFFKRKNDLDTKRRVGELEKFQETIMKEVKERELLQKELYQDQAKKRSAKVYEAEMKQKRAEEEFKKRKQEQDELRVQLNNCQKESDNIVLKSLEKINSCMHPSYLRVSIQDHTNQIKGMFQNLNSFVEDRENKLLTIDDILNANLLVKKIYEYLQNIIIDIDHAKVKALQEQEAQTHYYAKTANALPQESFPDSSVTSAPSAANEEVKKAISVFIAPDAVEEYHDVMEHFKHIDNMLKPFITDSRNKKYRFELQKSISTPINVITPESGSHVRDKVNRLLSILNGTVGERHGNESKNGSVAYNFCANLIAKRFVEQGDKQISSQHTYAFPFAIAAIGVWMKKPEVGKLILGHFYTNCPYLVPYYPPKQEGQSDQEYYESLGYHYDSQGVIEKHSNFLLRIGGYVRLYAAIIVSPLPPNSENTHPHGLSWGWKWLSRILNMEPRPDVTATILYHFLDVTGHALQKEYGKQFKKILHILCKDYFAKLKKVGSSGPVQKLENFLQQTVKKGYISPPEGLLEPGFWNR